MLALNYASLYDGAHSTEKFSLLVKIFEKINYVERPC